MTDRFETKDSGQRQEFASGMHRDTHDGKARFDLMVPEGVAYEDQILTRFAELLGRGAVKYTERNWEAANSKAEIDRAKSSAFRHFFQWLTGETDEDHAAAVFFNIMVVETIQAKVDAEHRDEVLAGRRWVDDFDAEYGERMRGQLRWLRENGWSVVRPPHVDGLFDHRADHPPNIEDRLRDVTDMINDSFNPEA